MVLQVPARPGPSASIASRPRCRRCSCTTARVRPGHVRALGDVVAADVNDDLRSTDQKVNQLEREIRRELAVHASVFGGIDTPAVLVYMSIVKDIERMGDYAKNLLDLALDGARTSPTCPTPRSGGSLAAEISQYITDAADAFLSATSTGRGPAHARRHLLDHFDDRVSALVRGRRCRRARPWPGPWRTAT
jgi:hypothetical protein